MKFRNFLRNFLETLIDRYRDEFLEEEKKTETVESTTTNADSFEEDFQALTDLSQKLALEESKDPLGSINKIGDSDTSINEFSIGDPNSDSAINGDISSGFPPSNGDFTVGETVSGIRTVASPGHPSGIGQKARPFPVVPTDKNGREAGFESNGIVIEPREVSSKVSDEWKQKSYSFTPRQSKANQLAREKNSKKKKRPGSFKIKIEKKAQIIHQISTLLESGMDLRSSLAILEEQEVGNEVLWFFTHELLEKIEGGDSLSEALSSSVMEFDESEIAMVRAGEAVGQQANTLAKMATLMEKKALIKKKIISAMVYPMTVLSISFVVVMLLTILVIPRFENVIADQIGPDAMPGLTKIILQVSQFIAAHWIAVLSLATTVFFMAVTANKIAIIKRIIYSFLLRTPLIGDCIKKWCVVLFARTFGYLLVCGCSLMESLKMAQKSVDNYQMKDNLTLTINDVQQGMSLSESLHRHNIFPAMAEGLIKIGEESGKLGEMLNKVSSSYEEQLNELITRITSLIEPFLIVFLAVFVGSVVIGLFLPLVSLIQNITG